MTKLHLTLATLTLSLGLAITGCDADSSCPDDDCVVDTPPGQRPAPDQGELPDDTVPPPCADACQKLLTECDPGVQSATVECERDCRADFTEEEIACLAALTCGEPADGCLG